MLTSGTSDEIKSQTHCDIYHDAKLFFICLTLYIFIYIGEAEQGRTWDEVWYLTKKYGGAVVLGAALAASPVGVAVGATGSLVKLGAIAIYACYLDGLCGGKDKERKED